MVLGPSRKGQKVKVIRFRRKGTIRYPLYDIIVTLKDVRNKGKALEKLGFYNPNRGTKLFFLDSSRLGF